MLCRIKATVILPSLTSILFGFFWTIITISVLLLTIPVVIYRLLVIRLSAILAKDNGKIVNLTGQGLATEFLPSRRGKPPRCTIVTTLVLDRAMDQGTCRNIIEEKWIKAIDEETGELMYPELQQYIEEWMGFMFWKNERNFDVTNHLHYHELEPTLSALESQEFLDNFIEELLNKPYQPRRSPWDLHFIYNVKYPKSSKDEKRFVVLFRVHHAMVDAYSINQLLVDNIAMGKISFPQQQQQPKQVKSKTSFTDLVTFPMKWLHSYSNLASTLLFFQRTPWHCPDSQKQWRQLYCRSPVMSTQRIKFIKNKIGCSFASVVLSAISAGAAYSFKCKGHGSTYKELQIGVMLPLPGRPKTLGNHMTAAVLRLPTDQDLDMLERVRKTDKVYREALSSLAPRLYPAFIRTISVQLARVTSVLYKNNNMCAGVTNFRGSILPTIFPKCQTMTGHSCTGGLDGAIGIVFSIIGLEDHLYITAVAEEAAFSRNELKEMMGVVSEEIDKLYKLVG